MKVRYLVALVSLVCASASWAREPFVVKDIRVDGIQRTEAGTVFSYLPVKVGDTLDDEKAAAAIKALYATGFFKDVRLESEDGVLVVVIEERPAIAQISIIGAKEFEKDKLKEGLKQAGLAESRIFRPINAGEGGAGAQAAVHQPRQICGKNYNHHYADGT